MSVRRRHRQRVKISGQRQKNMLLSFYHDLFLWRIKYNYFGSIKDLHHTYLMHHCSFTMAIRRYPNYNSGSLIILACLWFANYCLPSFTFQKNSYEKDYFISEKITKKIDIIVQCHFPCLTLSSVIDKMLTQQGSYGTLLQSTFYFRLAL